MTRAKAWRSARCANPAPGDRRTGSGGRVRVAETVRRRCAFEIEDAALPGRIDGARRSTRLVACARADGVMTGFTTLAG